MRAAISASPCARAARWVVLLCAAALLVCLLPETPGSECVGEEFLQLAQNDDKKDREAKAVEAEGTKEDEQKKPLTWDKPRFAERREEREEMVRRQIAAPGRDVKDKRVLEAMTEVPRHLFVPDDQLKAAYADSPLPIGQGQTISQPFIVAFMTEALELKAGDKVLEIGTGSGYQAAVLTELTPSVYTVEIIKPLAEQATKRLEKLGYKTVKVKAADGYFGWEENGPFDAIIVTCAAGHVPPPLLKQLKPGGRMIIPVGGALETQYLIVVSKDKDDKVRTEEVLPVRFVPMTGRVQEEK